MKKTTIILLALAVFAFGAVLYFSTSKNTGLVGGIGDQALPNPSNASAATSTGGSLPAGTYYFKVTSLDHAGGQTSPTSEFSCSTGAEMAGTSTACRVTMTPTPEAYATRLWVGTASGVYSGYLTATSSTLVATTTSLVSATIPSRNTAYLFNSGIEVDEAFLSAYVTANTLVKSGKTFVHSITYSPSDAAATAGTIAILDAIAPGTGTTTLYGVPGAAIAPNTIILDQVFTDGLYIHFTTTNDVNVNVSYK